MGELRRPGSEAESRAVARVAATVERSGWLVTPLETTAAGDADDSPLAFGVAAALAGLALELADRAGFGPPGMTALAGTFVGLVLVARLDRKLRTGSWKAPRIHSPGFHAVPRGASDAPVRVIFLTHSETRPPDFSLRLGRLWTALDALWLLLLWAPCWRYGAWAWLDRAGPALLAGLGLVALFRTLDPWAHRPWAYPGDNRTGLALIEELAQGWPATAAARVRVELVVVGRRDPEDWRELERAWSDRPTLVVNLEAPGVGDELMVVGPGEPVRLASEAATSLWVPHARSRFAPGALEHEAFRGIPGLTLTGPRGAEPVRPGLLAAAGQLAGEVALRWARHHAGEPASEVPPRETAP